MRTTTIRAAIAAICAAAALPSWAETKTWQGGGTQDANNRYLVSSGDNWSGGVAPVANDALTFGATGAGSVSFDAGFNFGLICFEGGTYDGYNSVTGTDIRVCNTDSATATLRKQDGDWGTTVDFRVGEGNGSVGTFQHSGGTLNIGRTLFVGSANYATAKNNRVTIDGGTVYVNGAISGNYRAVALGFKEKSTGMAYLTVSGTGRLIVTKANHIWIGRGGAGHMTIADDAVVDVSNGCVYFYGGGLARDNIANAKNSNCTCYLYLNGGTLLTQGIGYGAYDSKNHRLRIGMYFDGGTLKATANADNFIIIPYGDTTPDGNVRVLTNGGTIDTNGHTINVRQKLDPPGSGTSGDLIITGGGTYKQTGVTAYNGRTIVDGNTKYIKNNASSNLKLIVKGGSTFQNAAALASRVAGASLTFEDGAKFIVDCANATNGILSTAAAIDVQGALEISFSGMVPEGHSAFPILRITGSGTFPADILSHVTLAADAPSGVTLALSDDHKTISYNYAVHDWYWTGTGDGRTFGDGANWLGGNAPGASSDLLFVTAPATVENDIDDLSVASITFAPACPSMTITGKQITISDDGIIENQGDVPQTFAAPVTFLGAVQAKHKIYMNNLDIVNEGGRLVFAGGITCFQWNVTYDNRMMCGRWNCTNTSIGVATATNPRTTVYKNSSLVARELTGTQGVYIMQGAAVTNETMTVNSACVLSVNAGELVVNGPINFPATSGDKWTFSNRVGQEVPRFKARSITLSGSFNAALGYAATASASAPVDWYLGEDGMNVTGVQHFFMHHTGDVLNIHPWKCDTAINAPTGGSEYNVLQMNKSGIALNFFTDDEDGVARTITLNGTIWAAAGGTVTAKGSGTVAVKINQQFTANLSVSDTATYAIYAGCTNGTGIVTVGATATLKAVGAGRAEVGGLTLADGATLAFEFTDKAVAPVLAVVGGTGSVPSIVNVKITAADGVRPRGGAHILTSGADFTGATVNSIDAPEWVKRVGVDGSGNVFVEAKPKGLIIIVK